MIQINSNGKRERDNDIANPIIMKKFSQNIEKMDLMRLICRYINMFTNVLGTILEDKSLSSLVCCNKTIHSKLSTYMRRRKYFFLCRKMVRYSGWENEIYTSFLHDDQLPSLFIQFNIMEEGVFSEELCDLYLETIGAKTGTQINFYLGSFLHFLARSDCSLAFLKLFLAIFSRMNYLDVMAERDNITAFQALVQGDHCNLERFDSFLEAGADPFIRNSYYWSLQHELVYTNHRDKPALSDYMENYITRLSLLPGFDCNSKTKIGATILSIYALGMNVKFDLLKFFVDLGCDVFLAGRGGMNILHMVCGKENGGRSKRTVPLDVRIVEYLIDLGVDLNRIDNIGDTPLRRFCLRNKLIPQDLEILRLFIARGAHMGDIIYSIIDSPVSSKDKNPNVKAEFIREIVEKGGVDYNTVNGNLETPLIYLCRKGDFRLKSAVFALEELLKLGASTSIKGEYGVTAMHELIMNPDVSAKAVKCMFSMGVDFNIQNDEGKTPMDLLLDRGYPTGIISDKYTKIFSLFLQFEGNKIL